MRQPKGVAIIHHQCPPSKKLYATRSFHMDYIQKILVVAEITAISHSLVIMPLQFARHTSHSARDIKCKNKGKEKDDEKKNKRNHKYQYSRLCRAVIIPNNAKLYAFIQRCPSSAGNFPLKFAVLRLEPHCSFLHLLTERS